jgi:hypothetical protein
MNKPLNSLPISFVKQILKQAAKDNFLIFVRYIKRDYQVNWHHELICKYLDKFIKGEIKRLMIFTPPQHGKSQLVSRSLPAYILGRDPNQRIVLASYSADLSSIFNRDCQRIIDSPEYAEVFPNTKLNSSSIVTVSKGFLRNSDIFQIVDANGYLRTTGVGGALTGMSADYAIIDDPVKDSLEASSPTYQMRNWNWFNDVLMTRLHNSSKVLLTQTRWNSNDLSGLIIKAMEDGSGEKWTILNLPALKEDDLNPEDPRQVGEALWEAWHSRDRLLQIKSQNVRTFQSLYQQNPQPVETGGEFYKDFRIHRNTRDMGGIKFYKPDKPLHLSFDFNVNPAMHAVVFQIDQIGNNGTTQYKVNLIKEIVCSNPRNNTAGTCAEFKRFFPSHEAGLFIYGDAGGKHEDTRSEKGYNDYVIILKELDAYKPSLRVPAANPSVRMRGNFLNNIFVSQQGGIELIFDSACIATIEDFQFIKEDKDGKLKEKAVDLKSGIKSEKYGHLSDAVDYFICQCFAKEYQQYLGKSARFNTQIGKTFSRNTY